jgi:hypothetical protein
MAWCVMTGPDDATAEARAERQARDLQVETDRQLTFLRARAAAAEIYQAETTGPKGPRSGRRVDLKPFLDGTYRPPQPEVGAERTGGGQLLYRGRWHTVDALTGAGKSWFCCWHAIAEMRRGNPVVYAHFEETSAGGTIERIRDMAPDLDHDTIDKLLVWLDCSYRWTAEEWQAHLPADAALVCLDGRIGACGKQGWIVDKPESVGAYRELFVTPAVVAGAAVLTAGHPVKAPDRQTERHGSGHSAWLDEVDGVGFRMTASKESPLRRGAHGLSNIYSVKDRYGRVEESGATTDAGGKPLADGWVYLGSLHVDDSLLRGVADDMVYMSAPPTRVESPRSDLDKLSEIALKVIHGMPGQSFKTVTGLGQEMRAADHKFRQTDLSPALLKLSKRGLLDWPEPDRERAPRPGRLTARGVAEVEDDA